MQSVAERLADLPADQRAEVLGKLTEAEAEALLHDWRGFLARPEQIAPEGDWDIWLVLAGRGFGKTETGARWVKEQVEAGVKSIALIAETQKDLEEVMVARILAVHPEGQKPSVRYKPVRITWPNGAVALGYNGTEPNQLRGPEFEAAWLDELAKYRHARETWDMLQFGMRVGNHPRQIVTTTPRATELIKAIVAGQEGKIAITHGKTTDNASNLAPSFLTKIRARYEGTRLGRQELNAEILGDLPGALWTMASLDAYRLREEPKMARIVVAVDPAVTDNEESDEHGIIVVGLSDDQRGIVLEDASMTGSPGEWARRVASLYRTWGADAVVVEVNQGGDMVRHTLQTAAPNLSIREVRASRGKHIRAEPIAALYEQGRIAHVGAYPELETQMTQMTSGGYRGDGSPDRLDALVWGLSDLFPDMVSEPVKAAAYKMPAARGWMGS